MRAILTILSMTLIASPAFAERKTVGIGDSLTDARAERVDGVKFAQVEAPISRTIYLVDKINLPAGERLKPTGGEGEYCSDGKGYLTASIGMESSLCLKDVDGDGRFDEISRQAGRPKLKPPVPYRIVTDTVFIPLNVQKRIVYLGGTATEARFSYREFTREGLARPAFTEDLSIPIANFPVSFTLKGVRLTIFSQTAAGIDVEVQQ